MYSGDGIRVVHPLFQVEGGGSIPTSPLQLNIGWITVKLAIQLNELWHSRLPSFTSPPERCKAFGAECGGIFYAAAIWSPPVATGLNYTGRYELRRLAVAPDAPRNTASRMLRIMRDLIVAKMPGVRILVSYQDTEVHTGGIYKAAGWKAVAKTQGGERWDMPSRRRRKIQTTAAKIRWELELPSSETP